MKFFAVGMLATVFAGTVVGQTIQVNKENRTIAITTSSEASSLADTAAVSIGFITYGTDADSTYAEGSRLSNAILMNVKNDGVAADAITSRSQNLQPLGEADKVRFGKGLRFSLAQSWQVTVPAAKAASVLQAAISAGANDSGDIEWSLKQRESLQADAAEKALAHAREIADRMAKGLNARLGGLMYASNQQPSRFPAGVVVNAQTASAGVEVKRKAAPLAIAPDRVTESATVYAVFGLE